MQMATISIIESSLNMPNLQSHVTSRELSQALKEAGWPQEESLFYWYRQESYYGAGIFQKEGEPFLDTYIDEPGFPCKRLCSAPTASELMERMKRKTTFILTAHEDDEEFTLISQGKTFQGTVPDALAKLALFLKQEEIIKEF
jgi:hypothetical protein